MRYTRTAPCTPMGGKKADTLQLQTLSATKYFIQCLAFSASISIPLAAHATPRAIGEPIPTHEPSMWEQMFQHSLIDSLTNNTPFVGFGFADALALLVLVGAVYVTFRKKPSLPSEKENSQQGRVVSMDNYRQKEQPDDTDIESENAHLYRRAEQAWGAFSSDSEERDNAASTPYGLNKPYQPPSSSMSAKEAFNASSNATIPDSFDVEDFLKGAKLVFTRMQEAWDARDLSSISQFTTPVVFEELSKQAQQDPNPGHTELLMINANLLEVTTEENETVATVFFNVLMRDKGAHSQPDQVREIWHFLRNEEEQSMWLLDGIEQVNAEQ